MSLIERGLIPPAAQLTLDPSPVRNRIAPLHEPQVRHRPPQTGVDSVKCTLLGIIYIPYFAQELNSSIFLFCIKLQENLIMNPHFYNDYLFHKCYTNNS